VSNVSKGFWCLIKKEGEMSKKQIKIIMPLVPKYMKRDKAAEFKESMKRSAINALFHPHQQDGTYGVYYDMLNMHNVILYNPGPRDILFRRYR